MRNLFTSYRQAVFSPPIESLVDRGSCVFLSAPGLFSAHLRLEAVEFKIGLFHDAH